MFVNKLEEALVFGHTTTPVISGLISTRSFMEEILGILGYK